MGNIEAVSGLASLLCALPIGYLADTIGRSVVIRAGGLLLFVTAILQISILQYTVDIDVTNPDDDQKDTIALWVSCSKFTFVKFIVFQSKAVFCCSSSLRRGALCSTRRNDETMHHNILFYSIHSLLGMGMEWNRNERISSIHQQTTILYSTHTPSPIIILRH